MRNLSNLYVDGVVGIGTTSPNSILDIRGASAYFHIGNTSDSRYVDIGHWASGRIQIEAGNGDLYLKTQTSNYLALGTANVERLRIDSSGNVGIGTASPTTLLNVYSATVNRVAEFKSGDNGALIQISDDDTTSYVGSENGLTYIGQTASASANNLIINGSGNVGIGTTSPQAKLNVNGAGSGAGEIRISAGANNALFGIYRITGDASTYEKYLIGYNSAHGSQPNELSLKNIGGDITLYTGPGGSEAERMRITSTGNVGIGTTSPSNRLVVDSGATNVAAAFQSSDTEVWINLRDGSSGTASNNYGVLIGHQLSTGELLKVADSSVTTKFLVTTSGNVGIGTTSPGKTLSVVGAPYEPISWQRTSGTTGYLYSDSGGVGMYTGTSFSQAGIYMIANTSMDFRVNGAQRMYINSSGNVGIGTTSPNHKLHVDGIIGSSRSSSTTSLNGRFLVYWDNNNPTTRYLYGMDLGYNGTYRTRIFSPASYDISLSSAPDTSMGSQSSYTDHLVVKGGTGNVGIGTTSPAQKLHISGGHVRLNAAGDRIEFQNSNVHITRSGNEMYMAAYSGWRFYDMQGSSTRMLLTSSGNLLIGTTTDAGYKLDVNGTTRLNGQIYLNDQVNVTSGYSVNFGTSRIHSTSSSYFMGGNVGIGTTSPAQKLDVAGGDIILSSNATYIRSKDASGNTPRMFGINPSNDTYIGPIDPYAGGAVFYGVSANVSSQTFYTGASSRLHINSAGNVGIGTTSPAQKLHVVGNTVTTGVAYTDIVQTWSGTSIDFRHQDASVVMRVDTANARVGIGTTSPSYALDIERTTGEVAIQLQARDDSSNTAIYFGDNSDADVGSLIYNQGSNYMSFTANAGERMRITSNGSVGIGTTSPSYKLDVVDQVRITNDATITPSGNLSNGALFISNNGGSSAYSALQVKTTGGLGLAVQNNGNVGIGTASPAQKLHVVGKALITDDIQLTGSNPRIDFNSNGASSLRFYDTTNASERVRIDTSGNMGIGTTTPVTKLDVNGSITAGGKIFYSKSYSSLDTTGVAIAGLTTGGNGSSALYEFTMYGGNSGGYQKVVYSCQNAGGNWYAYKVIDEGTNTLDVESSANGPTITFTFKARSSTQYYSPRVHVEFLGSNIDTSYL